MSMENTYSFEKRIEMLEFIPKTSKIFLDVGCGEGLFSLELKNKFATEVWGVEISKNSYELAKNKLDKVLFGKIEDVINLIPDNYFDCIIFNDSLEHLVDPFAILTKIKNKLKKNNSYIVSSIPNIRNFYVLQELLIDKNFEYKDSGILDRTHLRFFTKKSIIKMFKELNYEIVSIKGINPLRSRKFELINFLLFNFLEDSRYLQFACVVKPIL